jgi:hypothetical protein
MQDLQPEIGIVLVLRAEGADANSRDGPGTGLDNGYYVVRYPAAAFTGVLEREAVCSGPFAALEDARVALERLKAERGKG